MGLGKHIITAAAILLTPSLYSAAQEPSSMQTMLTPGTVEEISDIVLPVFKPLPKKEVSSFQKALNRYDAWMQRELPSPELVMLDRSPLYATRDVYAAKKHGLRALKKGLKGHILDNWSVGVWSSKKVQKVRSQMRSDHSSEYSLGFGFESALPRISLNWFTKNTPVRAYLSLAGTAGVDIDFPKGGNLRLRYSIANDDKSFESVWRYSW